MTAHTSVPQQRRVVRCVHGRWRGNARTYVPTYDWWGSVDRRSYPHDLYLATTYKTPIDAHAVSARV